MADVITSFKLETTQYDSKLRDAAKGLKEIGRLAEIGGKDFTNFSQKQVEAARALGNTASGANNAKDRLKDLVGAFNDTANAYNNLSAAQQKSDFGKAMSQSLQQLQQRIKETKSELYSLGDAAEKGGSGGLFGGGKLDGMLQVFGGNVMTKIAGMGAGLVTELGDAVKQGIELAKQGEGIRIAFERLGRGDILQGLREATHGTVTDLELMKAAVKFNDFKLPLDELGTMLAFAQQKAKDTGQSVDYMVDSIVTGLGRKSLMILDNLGLSAAQIKERMAETGDMTKAVGAIIREEMSKAGDYVETAADRATQANVSLQNKMEELGRKFAPLEEASNNFWTSMKIGILDVVGGPLTNLLNKLTEAGRLMGAYGKLGGNTKVNRMIANLAGARQGNRQSIYQQQQSEIWKYINPREQQLKDIRAWQRGERNDALKGRIQSITAQYGSLDATKIQAEVDAAKKMLVEYQQAARSLLTPVKADIKTDEAEQNIASLTKKLKDLQEQRKKAIAAGDTDLSKNLQKQINQVKADIKGLGGSVTTTTTHKPTTAEQIAFDINKAGISSAKGVDTMPSVYGMADREAMKSSMNGWNDIGAYLGLPPSIWDAIRKQTGLGYQQYDAKQDVSKSWHIGMNGDLTQNPDDKYKEKTDKQVDAMAKLTTAIGGVSSIMSGLEQIGLEVPDEAKMVMNTIQGLMSIIQGVQAVISIFSTTSENANTAATIANTVALGALTTAMSVNTASNFIPFFAKGGTVPHAANGYYIPGNSYSGDATPILANAGELILNKSSQSTLAAQLQNNDRQSQSAQPYVTGEIIYLGLQNYLRANGYGQIVTTRNNK